MQGGANDIAQGRSVDAAAKTLRSMVQRGKQLDLRVAITEVVPWNGGHPTHASDSPPQRAHPADRRGGGSARLRVERGARGPAKPGRMRAEYVSDDQIHPTVAGYKRLGQEVELP